MFHRRLREPAEFLKQNRKIANDSIEGVSIPQTDDIKRLCSGGTHTEPFVNHGFTRGPRSICYSVKFMV